MLIVGAGDISGPNEVSTICYLLSTDEDNDGSAILDLSEAAEANILEVGDTHSRSPHIIGRAVCIRGVAVCISGRGPGQSAGLSSGLDTVTGCWGRRESTSFVLINVPWSNIFLFRTQFLCPWLFPPVL